MVWNSLWQVTTCLDVIFKKDEVRKIWAISSSPHNDHGLYLLGNIGRNDCLYTVSSVVPFSKSATPQPEQFHSLFTAHSMNHN